MMETVGGERETRIVYEFARLAMLDQWWHWFVLIFGLAALFSYVYFWYRRDWVELPRPLGWTLLVLRLAAILGLVFFYLDLQKRSEQRIVRPSRVAILVDTSLSMTLATSEYSPEPRISSIVSYLETSPVLEQLREGHDVHVYRFDQSSRPNLIAVLDRKSAMPVSESNRNREIERIWWWSSWFAWMGTGIGVVGVLLVGASLAARLVQWNADRAAIGSLVGTVGTLAAMVFIGVALVRSSEIPSMNLWQFQWNPEWATKTNANSTTTEASAAAKVAWNRALMANGMESRIGDSLRSLLELERGSPLAGIVLISDGQNNAGTDPSAAVAQAAAQSVRIHTIGIGSTLEPINLRVVEVDAPKRVYQGDRFRVQVLLQATGQSGIQASLQLRSYAKENQASSFTIEDEVTVELKQPNQLVPVVFDVEPKQVGEWVYEAKLIPRGPDSNDLDNTLDTVIRVIDSTAKVLIIAGGPTREYQFVRNLLYRDKTIETFLYLQTARPGISQEADELLDDFPRTIQEMARFDCVIAFDADWMALEQAQIEALERWVSEYAGGLILIAGPVATPRWTGNEGNLDRRAELLRGLAPVVLNPRASRLLSMGRYENEVPRPITLTADGMRSDFLDVANSPTESQSVWERFAGVYGFFACYQPKPGALVLAHYNDPSSMMNDSFPIYLAQHFYGAGRVVFQGGGEMWRLRDLGEHFFDAYYTKLTRWASQGRLLRDSDRGMLLVDKEEALVGDQVTVRAVLRDSQFNPLTAPSVEVRLVDPQQRTTVIVLLPVQDVSQPGVYVGGFLAKSTGTYSVELSLGGLASQEWLRQQVNVRIPAREIQRTQRNEPLLQEIASRTGGIYFQNLEATVAPTDQNPILADSLPAQDQINYLPGASDREFQKRLMMVLMFWIAGALTLEWLMRRISRLA